MKGVSTLVIAILLILISISLVGALYIWTSNVTFDIFPEEELNQQYQRSRACLSLEDLDAVAGMVNIRNYGLVPLRDLGFYLDNSLVSSEYPDTLNPNDVTNVTFTPPISGSHSYYAIADIAETPVITASN